jgi:antitoxin CptB
MNELENLRKKIIYRANYRGTKEMDILLSAFVKSIIDKLSLDELDELNALLNLEDEEIYNFYQNNTTSKNLTNNKIAGKLKVFKIL